MNKATAILLISALSISAQALETTDLKYIGMPVGGICTGQVYLGGDGQLWYWDIFNVNEFKIGSGAGSHYYLHPMLQDRRFAQGFAIRTTLNGDTQVRPLRQDGFGRIRFQGEYPVGRVLYGDDASPVEVRLQAFTPFIPTDEDNSGLPLVVMEYEVTNTACDRVAVDLGGWLQNTANYFTAGRAKGQHINRIETENKTIRLMCQSEGKDLDRQPDWGNMTLALQGSGKGHPVVSGFQPSHLSAVFRATDKTEATCANGAQLVGALTTSFTLKPGEKKTVRFFLSWYFPNINKWEPGNHRWLNRDRLRYYYSKQFKSSWQVAEYVDKRPELIETTQQWNKTWYDSTLPNWFLDRTFLNTSTLATTACVRFDDLTDLPFNEGRFYTFEGVYLGHGTCTHVFHYEQALGRVFPKLARTLRQQIDLGLSYQDSGVIGYRGEFSHIGHHHGTQHAIDGHAGTIMRIYREYLMSPDRSFLAFNWPRIKKSIRIMIDQDKEKTGQADGILEGAQYNTLDRTWYGKIAWTSGLYAAVLRAGHAMAHEMGDSDFAHECQRIAALAYHNMTAELFNGEYFVQKLDKDHLAAPNTNNGCHADQLLGQYWASQVGLGPIVAEDKIKSALYSIYKYNLVEHYGDYLDSAAIGIKRHYAAPDEKGMVMCSFPKGGADEAPGIVHNDWEKLVVGYFSEIWTGQEHHVAATMIEHGLIQEALELLKTVHERYSPEKRNPYNEIEYGNHYTRAMSGYAPFVAASGFYYHGPKGIIGFDPKIGKKHFKSAFIGAEGWGSYTQTLNEGIQSASIALVYGRLRLSRWRAPESWAGVQGIRLYLNGKPITFQKVMEKTKTFLVFDDVILTANDTLTLQ
jgi:non-lysosomal glucosylceramidase